VLALGLGRRRGFVKHADNPLARVTAGLLLERLAALGFVVMKVDRAD
jgi:hypothetical protein